MKTILAIDPGNLRSGWVRAIGRKIINGSASTINESIEEMIAKGICDEIACEWLQCYGMPVGKETFHTCRWIGRFQAAAEAAGIPFHLVYRRDVKLFLCNSLRAKDSNVSAAIKDLYPATGGGKRPVIGTKAQPGPLFGVTSHMWAALGLALTFQECRQLSPIQ